VLTRKESFYDLPGLNFQTGNSRDGIRGQDLIGLFCHGFYIAGKIVSVLKALSLFRMFELGG